MAGRSHWTLLSRVGEDVFVASTAVRKIVDVRQREVRARARSAGSPGLAVPCGEPAIRGNTGFDNSRSRWPISAVEMLFLAIHEHLDRSAGSLCESCAHERFSAGLSLAAEAAAHV